MKVIGEVNNISKELLATIPPLKKGQVAVFRMLTGVKFLHVNEDGSEFTTEEFGNVQIPLVETIKDLDGTYKEIGVVDNHADGVVTKYRFFVPGLGEKFAGKFSCTGGNIKDEELFQHLWISNRNAKNPNRDESVEAMFEPVDYMAESKLNRKKRTSKIDALNFLRDADLQTIKEIIMSLNRVSDRDEEVLRDELEQLAEEDPELFLKVAFDPATKTKAVIKKGLEYGIVKFDTIGYKLSWGGTSNVVICTLGKSEGVDYLDQIGEWIQTNSNGIKVIKAIKDKLTEKLKLSTAASAEDKE